MNIKNIILLFSLLSGAINANNYVTSEPTIKELEDYLYEMRYENQSHKKDFFYEDTSFNYKFLKKAAQKPIENISIKDIENNKNIKTALTLIYTKERISSRHHLNCTGSFTLFPNPQSIDHKVYCDTLTKDLNTIMDNIVKMDKELDDRQNQSWRDSIASFFGK